MSSANVLPATPVACTTDTIAMPIILLLLRPEVPTLVLAASITELVLQSIVPQIIAIHLPPSLPLPHHSHYHHYYKCWWY